MLCLLTYADIKAVNPEALTPWKAENVWQLYIAASNFLNRHADQGLNADSDDESLSRLQSLAPVAGKSVKVFLEGLPKRYLRTFRAEEILRHFEMSEGLVQERVQLRPEARTALVCVVRGHQDRPFLFANIAGTLAAWGMNIVKADAFSNARRHSGGYFYFTDRFRTLELNLPEWERVSKEHSKCASGEADLDRLLRDRERSEKNTAAKVKIDTRIEFDDEAPSKHPGANCRSRSHRPSASDMFSIFSPWMQYRDRLD